MKLTLNIKQLEVFELVLEALEKCDGCCLDNPIERVKVACTVVDTFFPLIETDEDSAHEELPTPLNEKKH